MRLILYYPFIIAYYKNPWIGRKFLHAQGTFSRTEARLDRSMSGHEKRTLRPSPTHTLLLLKLTRGYPIDSMMRTKSRIVTAFPIDPSSCHLRTQITLRLSDNAFPIRTAPFSKKCQEFENFKWTVKMFFSIWLGALLCAHNTLARIINNNSVFKLSPMASEYYKRRRGLKCLTAYAADGINKSHSPEYEDDNY